MRTWTVSTEYRVGSWYAPTQMDIRRYQSEFPGWAMSAAEHYLREAIYPDARILYVSTQTAD